MGGIRTALFVTIEPTSEPIARNAVHQPAALSSSGPLTFVFLSPVRLGGRLAGQMAPRYAKDQLVGHTMHMAFHDADSGMTQTVAK